MQTTEDGGGLAILLNMYIKNEGEYKNEVSEIIPKIGKGILAKTEKSYQVIKMLLEKTGKDEIMQKCQDDFFELHYYRRAEYWFSEYGFTLPLSMLVIFDSFVHSGEILPFLRSRFKTLPPNKGGEEKQWILQYCIVRDMWLKNHSNLILRKTTYRTDSFLRCIAQGNWSLQKDYTIQYEKGIVTIK
jgi:chitosanase